MKNIVKKLPEVQALEYTVGSRSTQFHPQGLFSEIIFGPKDSKERKDQYAFIDLHCKILHPALMKCLSRMNGKLVKVLLRKAQYNFDESGNLIESEDGELNGVTSIIQNFRKIINGRTEDSKIRADMQKMLNYYFDKDMVFIDKCLVIPAFYRDAQYEGVGTQAGLRIPPINEFYQKIIKLSIQISSLSMEPGTIMYEIYAAKMQQLVNDLVDYIYTKITKKSGLVRQNILSKRIDFCGRAVIVGGAHDIKPDEIGVPFKMLVKLYEPFLLYELYNSGHVDSKLLERLMQEYNGSSLSIVSLRSLLTDIQKGHVLTKEFEDIIKSAVKTVISDKALIAKRDPCLHAESIRAYKPIMVDGDAIRLAPTACTGHNADFDGDTMCVYTPMTKESLEEVKSKLLTSYSMDGMTICSDDLSKDYCIGVYNLTKDNIKFKKFQPKIIKNEKDLEGLHPNYPIIIGGKTTTVGRHIWNKMVPDKKFQVNTGIGKKEINKFINQASIDYGSKNPQIYADFVNKIIELGGKYYTLIPATFSIDDLQVPASIMNLKKKLDGASPAESQLIIDKMEKLLKEYLEENQLNFGVVGKAGGLKGGYGQLRQILICKGIIADTHGNGMVVKNSYGSGMNSREFFTHAIGSRNGVMDRVLNTAPTGYLSRRLAYALQRVECNPDIKDCGTRRTVKVKVTDDIAKRLVGRYVYNDDNKLELFDPDKWTGKIIRLRSPIYCKTTRLCRHCYGELALRNRTKNVGILAGQILGERLTQVSMKQFHVGGGISYKFVDIKDELTKMLDNSQKVVYDKNFRNDETKLYCSTADGCKLTLLRSYYPDKKDLEESDEKLSMKYGYFTIECSGVVFDCTIDNMIDIPLQNKDVQKTDSGYIINIKQNDVVFDCVPTPQIFSKQVKLIENVFDGKTPYKSPDHYLQKIYMMYKGMDTRADLVHMEVCVSNLLRDATNPSYPARLNPKEYRPKIISLNAIPAQESWFEAFCFQNSKEAITNGLLYDRNETQTILERLATQNL